MTKKWIDIAGEPRRLIAMSGFKPLSSRQTSAVMPGFGMTFARRLRYNDGACVVVGWLSFNLWQGAARVDDWPPFSPRPRRRTVYLPGGSRIAGKQIHSVIIDDMI